MSQTPDPSTTPPDPDESPFEIPPIEGLPYKRGSVEEKAIERVIEEYERAQRAAEQERRAESAN